MVDGVYNFLNGKINIRVYGVVSVFDKKVIENYCFWNGVY